MAISADFLHYVLGQLSALEGLVTRRMFGAVGLYSEGAFFGFISADVLYFKVSDANQLDYESRNMDRFRPYRDQPGLSMRYYEVPVEVLEDADECIMWARRSVGIARAAMNSSLRKSTQTSLKSKRRANARKHSTNR
jgi:DNA transformation protein and related proteins